MRYLFLAFLFISTSLFSQRDSVINKIKCHLISESDTGTAWIQTIIVKKGGVKKFAGFYFEVYPGGKLKAKGYYKRGKRTEKWIRYYSNGQKSEEGYFDGGFKSDLWMTYYESGKMSWKGSFFKNMRSGFWRYYYEDGQLKAMTRYRIKTESITKKPKEASTGRSIKVNREIHYSISPADSLVEYYPDGKLRTRIIYGKEGGLNGNYAIYYPDGKFNTQGNYISGNPTGSWMFYCEGGELFEMKDYTSGDPGPTSLKDKPCTFEELRPWLPWTVELLTP